MLFYLKRSNKIRFLRFRIRSNFTQQMCLSAYIPHLHKDTLTCSLFQLCFHVNDINLMHNSLFSCALIISHLADKSDWIPLEQPWVKWLAQGTMLIVHGSLLTRPQPANFWLLTGFSHHFTIIPHTVQANTWI